jgi:hypothetical protein
MKATRATLLLLSGLAATGVCAHASTPGSIDEYQEASLRGMSPIALGLNYSDLPELAAEPGLNRDALINAAEVQLQRSGVDTQRMGSAAPPGDDRVLSFLTITVNVARLDESLYAFSLEVGARQSAMLIRDPTNRVLVQTWRTGFFGVAPRSDLARSIRLGIEDSLNIFLNDYLRQNRRRPST